MTLTLGGAPARVETAGYFSGRGLSFAVAGAGAVIEAASGVVVLSAEVLRAGEPVTVTARNSGGSAEIGFRVTVAAEPPASRVAPSLRGSGVIGSAVEVDPGEWSGAPAPELALQWRAGDVAIPGATGASFVPTPAEDGVDLDCLVTAQNAGGSVALAAGPLKVTEDAPAVSGALADVTLTLGGAPARVETAGYFSGRGLSFAVAGAGAVIEAASGVVVLSAEVLRAGEPVTVTARNSGGSVTSQFRVTVSPAKLDPKSHPDLRDHRLGRPRQGRRRPAAADRRGRHRPKRLRTSLVLAGRY